MAILNKLNRRKNPDWGLVQQYLGTLDYASRVIINCDEEEIPECENVLEECEERLAELKALDNTGKSPYND